MQAHQASTKTAQPSSDNDFRVFQWQEDEFTHNQQNWQLLLENSTADSLFLSWHWVNYWWKYWGCHLPNAKLCILAVVNKSNVLVGIAPLYISQASHAKGLLTSQRLQLIGSAYRQSAFRSEYLGFIVQQDVEAQVTSALWSHVFSKLKWDELYLSDLPTQGATYQALTQRSNKQRKAHYSRIENIEPPYSVDCTGTFENYIAQLGKNTRLKLFNRRKNLATLGKVAFTRHGIEAYDDVIQELNKFHQQRWGKDCFPETMSKFHRELAQQLHQKNNLWLNKLTLDECTIALSIDYQAKGKLYNIQLGFAESDNNKISYGTLHLGYVIEAAFKSSEIAIFDMLVGTGKNDNYKERIGTKQPLFISTLIIRNPILKFIYKAYDNYLQRKPANT